MDLFFLLEKVRAASSAYRNSHLASVTAEEIEVERLMNELHIELSLRKKKINDACLFYSRAKQVLQKYQDDPAIRELIELI